VTMVWVGWYNLGLRALLALQSPISPLTSSGQRNCASWVSQLQKWLHFCHAQEGGARKVHIDMCWHWGGSTIILYIIFVKASNIQYDQSRILNYILV